MKRAVHDFDDTVEYLERKWGVNSAISFSKRIEQAVQLIQRSPNTFKEVEGKENV